MAFDAITTLRCSRLVGLDERPSATCCHMAKSALIAMHIGDRIRAIVAFHAWSGCLNGTRRGVVKSYGLEAIRVGMAGCATRAVVMGLSGRRAIFAMMRRFRVAGLADAVIDGVTICERIGSLGAEKLHVDLRYAGVAIQFVGNPRIDSIAINNGKPLIAGPDFGQSHGTLDRDGVGGISYDAVVVVSSHPVDLARRVHCVIFYVREEYHPCQAVW